MTSREKNTGDEGDEIANQGPLPPEPEDTPDTGEGRLAPQPGGDAMESDEDEG